MATLTRLLLGGLLATIAACGGAPAKSATPTGGASEVDGLSDEIEAAARTIGELGPPPGLGASAPGAAPTSPSPPAAEPVPEEKKAEPKKDEASGDGGESGASQQSPAPPRPSSSCETACKALGSMKRSQERICEIAGDSHDKCTWATQKVADATSRVERAGCDCS